MTSVLVTGASGFIGRHLMSALAAEGHQVAAVTRADGDVVEKETWAALPTVECVVHLAARSFVPDSWTEPGDFMRTNLLGTTRALEFCRARSARLVFISSYMYGNPERLPIPESAPVEARNPYALSKLLSEQTCRFFADSFGVDVTVLRPFNVYGPGQTEPFLIPFLVRQLRDGGPIRVKDLRPRRDYVHVRDVVTGIVRATSGPTGFRVYNLGSGVSHSVDELIAELQRAAGTSLPVASADEPRQDEVMDTVADVTAAREELGWRPLVGLRQGLATLLEVATADSRR